MGFLKVRELPCIVLAWPRDPVDMATYCQAPFVQHEGVLFCAENDPKVLKILSLHHVSLDQRFKLSCLSNSPSSLLSFHWPNHVSRIDY